MSVEFQHCHLKVLFECCAAYSNSTNKSCFKVEGFCGRGHMFLSVNCLKNWLNLKYISLQFD